MGGGNHSDINPNGLCATDLFKFTFFQYFKNFYLQIRTHVTDFIQKYGSSISQLEFS